MDNENKEKEFDPLEIELDLSEIDGISDKTGPEPADTAGIAEPVGEADQADSLSEGSEEKEFDPTESEDFYNNLEATFQFDEPAETISQQVTPVVAEEVVASAQNQGEETATDDDLFAGVSAALTEQIEHEFGKNSEVSSAKEPAPQKKRSLWKAIPTWIKVLVSVIAVILIAVGLLFGTPVGRKLVIQIAAKIALNEIPVDPSENQATVTPGVLTSTPVPTEPAVSPEPTIGGDITPDPTDEPVLTPEPTAEPTTEPVEESDLMDDEDIINILLCGVENEKGQKFGRSDAILLLSINLNGGNLKLVSFMRDSYVQIPGHADDKLNHSYAYGGGKLAMETIEKNFKVDVDAFVTVNFKGFEDFIDELGGLKISLTSAEAKYLNGEGKYYISNPAERNVVPGIQKMTGSQVLGFCRVRHIKAANGDSYDRGRNYRHRTVLKALFEQYVNPLTVEDGKQRNLTQWWAFAKDFLNKGYITRSEGLTEVLVADCFSAVIENKMFDMESLAMPYKDPENGKAYYDDEAIRNGQEVVVWYQYEKENVEALQKFIYGE